MLLEMDFKPPLSAIGSVAAREGAPEHFELFVSLHMVLEVAFGHKGLLAIFISAGEGTDGGL
jgi:hypothetical protein